MQAIATSVRINVDAGRVLSALAAKLDKPKAQVVELALRELEEKTFWADVSDSFEQTAADPSGSASQAAETALWDRASGVDFQDEPW